MKADTFSLQILRGVSGIERLKSDWDVMFTSMSPRDFYHAYSWHHCYLRHLSTDPDDVLFCFISSAELCCQAIVPLETARIRYFGIDLCQLRIPSHPHLPLRDVIVSANWTHELPVSWFIRELNTQLPFRWHFLLFDCALPQSNILKILRPSIETATVIEHPGYSSYIVLNSTDPLRSLSKNFRSNLSRARNKLAKFRTVEIETTNRMPDLKRAFDDFMHVEAAGWKGEKGTKSAIKFNQSLVAFYNCLICESSENVQCEISILRVDSIPVAAQFGLIIDETVYQLKIGFDENYSDLSPGNMLIENLLSEYRQRDLKCFNLVSHTDWHKNWRAARQNLHSCYVFNNTLPGRLLYFLRRIKQLLRPTYQKFIRPLFSRPLIRT